MFSSVKCLSDDGERPILAIILEFPEKQKKPRHARMAVTPELARYWLEKYNTHNRKMVDDRWQTIAVDIIDGRWHYTAKSIAFCDDGTLLDGQNRLRACIESGKPIDTLMAFGLSNAAQDYTDTNKVRTAGDIGHLKGVENANQATAVAKMLLWHERFGINCSPKGQAEIVLSGKKATYKWSRPTKNEIVEAAQTIDGLAETIQDSHDWCRQRLIPPRVIAFCYHLFRKQDAKKAHTFFDQSILAINLVKGSPTHWLHSRLVENRASKARLLQTQLMALIFKAWIFHRDGFPARTLRWANRAGEQFPTI